MAIVPNIRTGMQNKSMTDVLFSAETVVVDQTIVSQKQLFQDMATRIIEAHDLSITCRDVVAAAMERERLGSTGVGNGVALPHARIDGIDRRARICERLHACRGNCAAKKIALVFGRRPMH